MPRYNQRYDMEPCAAAKDAAILAHEEGTKAGRLLLAAALNPYADSNRKLAGIWEDSRREATLRRLP